ncbi:putative phosphatidylglycerophosphatase [Rosa chinensis]|uniref:Putative phosphatidylglycerophosphatase n=1 Tax=Rosa chinensis TaxID=74649 RepID=A0A2P6S086_ROSCH|nr:phosphatidylglycerophosphate phosphatase 1, chloroplastic/mitochondrial isoform X2 [Rosa chinensis]PRQ52056.1 putative phosphatidylglycerophosphatase [Rosa chinensis]
MQSTSSPPLPKCPYALPNPSHHFFHHPHHPSKNPNTLSLPQKPQTHFTAHCALSISHTNSCSRDHPVNQNHKRSHRSTDSDSDSDSDPYHYDALFLQFNSPGDTDTSTSNDEGPESPFEDQSEVHRGVSSNMWWADLKAALGQRLNFGAIVFSARVLVKDQHLALPHVSVPDIRHIDWVELHRRGFKGVVFDKDNTLTVPYSLTLWGPLGSSLEQCKSVFGPDIAVFSNSAGLNEYDHDGSKARELEGAIGIKVIRHRLKKPAGTAEEIEKHFGCQSSHLIMVGDRPLTDIVYGNQNGFLTILTGPLSLAEEPFIVRQVRKLETALVNSWSRKGLKPMSHRLLPDGMQCVKHPPPL